MVMAFTAENITSCRIISHHNDQSIRYLYLLLIRLITLIRSTYLVALFISLVTGYNGCFYLVFSNNLSFTVPILKEINNKKDL